MTERRKKALAVAGLFAPTIASFVMDLALRGRALWNMAPDIKWSYVTSSFIGGGLWFLLLYGLARLSIAGRTKPRLRLVHHGVFALVVFPIVAMTFVVQGFYCFVFGTMFTRDTLRTAIAFRSTISSWIVNVGVEMLPGVAIALLATVLLAYQVRRTADVVVKTVRPLIPILGFVLCQVPFWLDDERIIALRSPRAPDAAFQNSVIGALKDALFPQPKRGLAVRPKVTVPPIPPRAHRPNVLFIITESVRADAMCSEKSDTCQSQFLDRVVPDRVGLRRATVQAPSTVISCTMLWTGLPPDTDFETGHRTPLLWEVAKAAGYRTAYIGAQDLGNFDLGLYLSNAGIDLNLSAKDFGGIEEVHIGAPDERATGRALEEFKQTHDPLFMVLHLSNTHQPCRVAPELQPHTPHDDSPFKSDITALKNHYLNSVLLQERTLAELFEGMRALPSFDDTVILFTSDHGEQFTEHGYRFHPNSLFEEELRVPGFVVAGKNALDDPQRAALDANRGWRVYSQDFNASILDLLGALDTRPSFPHGAQMGGRSIFRPPPAEEPLVPLSTYSGVWGNDTRLWGVMLGDKKVIGRDSQGWTCYDVAADPAEKAPSTTCPPSMLAAARARFPWVPDAR